MYTHTIKNFGNIFSLLVLLFAPFFLQAAGTDSGVALAQGLMEKINDAILFPLIALMSAIALIMFLYGAFNYVRGASNDDAREKGRKHLLYGTIGLLVMLSAFTILSIAAATFGLENELEDVGRQNSNIDTVNSGNSNNFLVFPE